MKNIKRISAFLVALVMVFGMTTTAFAAESYVTYEGGAEKFVFLPGSEYTDTDLFDNFKGVMPGDVLTEQIKVTNESSNSDYVNVYMKAVAHDETNNLSETVAATEDLVSMKDFLAQLDMRVLQGEKVLFEAKASELDGLKEYVLLGSFEKGEGTDLTVELSVPIELDNKYANRVGEVDWVFAVEELNYPPDETPETGDTTQILPYVGILGVAGIGAIALFLLKRKDNEE